MFVLFACAVDTMYDSVFDLIVFRIISQIALNLFNTIFVKAKLFANHLVSFCFLLSVFATAEKR